MVVIVIYVVSIEMVTNFIVRELMWGKRKLSLINSLFFLILKNIIIASLRGN